LNLVEQIVELAKEIESEDPIDFGMLQLDEESAYRVVANKVIEIYLSNPAEQRDMILLATATKLMVENFALNLEKVRRNE
jgi:hypothetical protein